ncbi:MAG: quinone-dependent dihydroorotate dehydrogenase [Chloroflexota bacterium]
MPSGLPDWRAGAYRLARPVLFRFDPERIHRLIMRALRGTGGSATGRRLLQLAGGVGGIGPSTSAQVMGLRLRNRVGLGAGFDKDGEALPGWASLGFGFAEIGTVTPRAQPGNARPRLLRVPARAALVNRMGFNNHGAAALARHVMLAREHLPAGFMVGVSIGRGRQTDDARAVDDYLACHRLVAPVADYVAVNVSSPNTRGLRNLQAPEALGPILAALADAGERLQCVGPLLVKISPDLDGPTFDALIMMLADSPAAGVIVSNTTATHDAAMPGGLSGAPLLAGTLAAISRARQLAGERLAIVATGGISSAADVLSVRQAGADLVQLWTGLIYRGPGLIGEAARAAATIEAA